MSALKKILSIALCLTLLLGIIPGTSLTVHAEPEETWVQVSNATSLKSNLESGNNVMLIEDIQEGLTETITISTSVKLDLNGHTIQSSGVDDAFVVTGNFTITDSSPNKNGFIKAATKYSVIYCQTGTLTINYGNLKYESNTYTNVSSAAIYNKGTVNISGGTIDSDCNHTIASAEGTLNISGGTLKGYDVIYSTGTVNISGGSINGTDAAVYCDTGKLNITGGELSAVDLGTVIVNEKGIVNISQEEGKTTKIVGVTAVSCFGDDAELTISGGTLTGTVNGIDFFDANDNSKITITGGNIKGTEHSLVLYSTYSGKAEISGGTFDGEVLLENGGEVSIAGGTFGEVSIGTPVGEESETHMRNVTISGDGVVITGKLNVTNQSRPQITGGKFEGKIVSNNDGPEISGGAFVEKPDAAFIPDTTKRAAIGSDGLYHIVAKSNTYHVTATSVDKVMGTLEEEVDEYYIKEAGAKVVFTAEPNPGYSFVKWSDGHSQRDKNPYTWTVSRNARWIAYFEPKTYTVTYNGNGSDGGTAVESQTHEFAKEENLRANTFTKTGYTFLGWSKAATDTTPDYPLKENDSFDPVTSISADGEDITLYAIWEINKFEVTFEGLVDSQTVEYGSKATKPTDPTKKDYEFVEWQLNGVAFDFDTPITQNTALTAKWNEIKYEDTTSATSKTWIKGATGSLTITFKRNNDDPVEREDGTISKTYFEWLLADKKISVDGEPLTDDNYEASDGSLNIKLKDTFLNTLTLGNHTLTVEFYDMSKPVSTTFTVKAKPAPVTPSYEVPKTGIE